MAPLILENGMALIGRSFTPADVMIGDDGRIDEVRVRSGAPGAWSPAVSRLDLQGRYLAPGFLDQHFHGARDKTCVADPLAELAAIEAGQGVTGFLACLMECVREPLLKLVAKKQAEVAVTGGARCLGFFLEGPFMALAGAAQAGWIMPVDLGYAKELLAAGGGKIRLVMVSPELEGVVALIELLRSAGVVVALGHTGATVEQTRRAVEAGARVCTHAFNVYQKLPDVTEPGVWPVGVYDALTADERVTCEMICDGIHVNPIKAKILYRAKGVDRLAIVTDSNVGAGLPPGRYQFPNWPAVEIREGDAVRDPQHGWLSGSAITMAEGVRRAVRILNCPLAEACTMASATIANALEVGHEWGKIAPRYHADLVVLDETLQVRMTLVAGQVVYQN